MRVLAALCRDLEEKLPITNSEIFSEFAIPEDYPWHEKMTDETNMYACLYGLARAFSPTRVLEVGTGWGLSLMTWLMLRDSGLGFVRSFDCGNFEREKYEADNLRLVEHTLADHAALFSVERINTQTLYQGRNQPKRWVRLGRTFDVLFIDGDHGSKERPWALFSDLWQFWPFLSPGGLCICDDLHDPQDYEPGRYFWLGYTWDSFHEFLSMFHDQVKDWYIWGYPCVPSGKRPVGLLVKR